MTGAPTTTTSRVTSADSSDHERASGPRRWYERQNRGLLAALLVVALVGAIAASFAMPARLGTGGDAATYMGVARNIDDGKGITSPFVNELDELSPSVAVDVVGHAPLLLWPPLYPVMLAAGSELGLDPETTAHLIQMASIALAGVFVVLLTFRLANRSTVTSFAAGLAFVLSPPVQSSVIASYADPAFLAMALGCVLLLARAVRRQDWLSVAAFTALAAAAALTRYVGFGIVLGGVACFLTTRLVPWRRRWRFALVALVGLAPAAWWLVTVRQQVPNPIGQASLAWRGDIWNGFTETAAQWLAPTRLPDLWRALSYVAALVLVLPVVIRSIAERSSPAGRRRREARSSREATAAWRASAWIAAGLSAVIVGSAMTIGAQLAVNGRMLMAIEAIAIAWFAASAAGSVRVLRELDVSRGVMKAVVGVPLAIIVSGVVVVAAGNLDKPFTTPFVAEATPDEAAALARALDGTPVVFANSPTELYVLTERGSAALPSKRRAATNAPHPEYDKELDDVRRVVRARNGAIVFFASATVFNPDVPSDLDFVLGEPGAYENVEVSPAIHILRPTRR